MIKNIILTSVVIFLLMSCAKKFTGQVTPPGEDWKISEAVYEKIDHRFDKCGFLKPCHDATKYAKFIVNAAERDYLYKTYGRANVTEIDHVRYRHIDENRYRRLWGLERGSEAGKVRGYATRIFKVNIPATTYNYNDKINAKKRQINAAPPMPAASVSYYYAYRLCPPPLGSCE